MRMVCGDTDHGRGINCYTFNIDASGSISCCGTSPVGWNDNYADIYIDLDAYGIIQAQDPGNRDAGNLFSQNCGNPSACGYTNPASNLFNIAFDINYVYFGTTHVITYSGGTLNYYYDPAISRKQPVCNDNAFPLSVNPAAGSNSCTESSYCQFFTTAGFSEDDYTAMIGVVDPTQPNDNIEMAMEDWEGSEVSGHDGPNPNNNGHNGTSNNANIALDSATAHYYAGINAFTYNVNNS